MHAVKHIHSEHSRIVNFVEAWVHRERENLSRDKDRDWHHGLLLKQGLLVKEFWLVQHHLEILQTEMIDLVGTCREGQILLSVPPIGMSQAATIITTVGTIATFEQASELKCSFDQAPRQERTGISFDRTKLDPPN